METLQSNPFSSYDLKIHKSVDRVQLDYLNRDIMYMSGMCIMALPESILTASQIACIPPSETPAISIRFSSMREIDQLLLPLLPSGQETMEVIAGISGTVLDELDKVENQLLAKKLSGQITSLEEMKLRHVQSKKDSLLGLDRPDEEEEKRLSYFETLLEQGRELIAKIDLLLNQVEGT